MRDYPQVLSRLIDTPLLAHPAKAEIVLAVVMRRAGVEVNIGLLDPRMGPVQERKMVRSEERYSDDNKAFLFDPQTGTAVIEITGSLAHRQGFIGESSGVMGYDGIGAQLGAAEADAEVKRILFDIHSCGGEVSGCFQLADRIAAASKPTIGLANELAFSAAYAQLAACDEVFLASETSDVGSVGVISLHMSYEGWLKTEGIKPTIIKAGDHKDDGNPFEDLPKDVLARLQAQVDQLYQPFVARVAQWRGLSESAVRETKAGTFIGRDALGVGFADAIVSPEEIFAAFAA